MLVAAKIIFAMLFVITGGAVFTEWGRRHKFLVFAASAIALLGAYYLADDIYNDIKNLTTNRENSVSYSKSDEEANIQKSIEINYSEIGLQKEVGKWRYNLSDEDGGLAVVKYNGKDFVPPIEFDRKGVNIVRVYSEQGGQWAAVVGMDIDGLRETYYADIEAKRAIFSKDSLEGGAYWSPSKRYMVTLNTYEGMWLSLLDTSLETYRNGDLLVRGDNPLFGEGLPLWPEHEKYFLLRVTERVDPWTTKPNRGRVVDTHLLRVELPSLEYSVVNSTSPMLK